MNYKDFFKTNSHLLEEPEVEKLLKVCYYFMKRCELAENIIKETPCVLGTTINQIEAWRKYEEFMKENNLNK